MKNLQYVLYWTPMKSYLHAFNAEISVLTWCEDKQFGFRFTEQQIDKVLDKLRKEFPKYNELNVLPAESLK